MKIKKISALVLSLMLVFAMSISAFAASKNDIISKLESANVPAEYVSQAKNYLANNPEIKPEQLDKVAAKIDAAVATANGVKDLASLTAEQKAAIMADVQSAASEIGVTIAKNADNSFTATDAKGNTYQLPAVGSKSGSIVKPTGFTTAATVGVVAVLAMGLVVCAFVSKKKVA